MYLICSTCMDSVTKFTTNFLYDVNEVTRTSSYQMINECVKPFELYYVKHSNIVNSMTSDYVLFQIISCLNYWKVDINK